MAGCVRKREKNGRNAFRTGAKIRFNEKKYFRVEGTLIRLEENIGLSYI